MAPVAESSGTSHGAGSGTRAAPYDRRITVFSPEGRLYQVDYALNSVKLAGVTTVAVRGFDSVCVITHLQRRQVTDKLMERTPFLNMYEITERLGFVATGMEADGRLLAHQARNEAAEFRFKWGYEMPPKVLAQWIADQAQICTHHAYKRPYGVVAMILGIDEETGTPQLFTCDPAGNFLGHKAASAGLKDREAMDFLEKEMMSNPSLSWMATIKMAKSALEYSLKENFKPQELEVGLVRKQKPTFLMGRPS